MQGIGLSESRVNDDISCLCSLPPNITMVGAALYKAARSEYYNPDQSQRKRFSQIINSLPEQERAETTILSRGETAIDCGFGFNQIAQ
jgi:hypothetical protein